MWQRQMEGDRDLGCGQNKEVTEREGEQNRAKILEDRGSTPEQDQCYEKNVIEHDENSI